MLLSLCFLQKQSISADMEERKMLTEKMAKPFGQPTKS